MVTVRSFFQQVAFYFMLGYALKFGERTSIFIFTFLDCLATFLTPFCKNMWVYIGVSGVLQGLSGGTSYFIPVMIGWSYFPKMKGLVTSLIMIGYSASPYILGGIISRVVNPDNIAPDEVIPNGKGTLLLYGPEVTKNVPKMWYVISAVNFAVLLFGMFFLRRPNIEKKRLEQVKVVHDKERPQSFFIGSISPGSNQSRVITQIVPPNATGIDSLL
jgi:MFS family permease